VSWTSVARNLVLAACFALLPLLPAGSPSTEGWLGLGLIVALVACIGLAIAVLALAREIGMLRVRLGTAAAPEIRHEGPELGRRVELVDRFPALRANRIGLAVFTSEDSHTCRALAPAISTVRSDPDLDVEVFDESFDADVWDEYEIPGSPYALAVDADGLVLAKGTFRSLAQLESVVGTASRRRANLAARYN
jgi:hypothetical protein